MLERKILVRGLIVCCILVLLGVLGILLTVNLFNKGEHSSRARIIIPKKSSTSEVSGPIKKLEALVPSKEQAKFDLPNSKEEEPPEQTPRNSSQVLTSVKSDVGMGEDKSTYPNMPALPPLLPPNDRLNSSDTKPVTSPSIKENQNVENIPKPSLPLWRKNAVGIRGTGPESIIAIVIDDAGLDKKLTRQAINLPGPLTFSFMTYASRIHQQVLFAKDLGHEVMVHVPMEPFDLNLDPGPNFLAISSTDQIILKQLKWSLSRVPGAVGINNHMGSKFTSNDRGMRLVMGELRRKGLLFLDSRTTDQSIAPKFAKLYRVPFAVRNVFLDHDPSMSSIKKQLSQVESYASKNGYAIAIGHPRKSTIESLSQWLPILVEKGLVLVPLSAVIAKRMGIKLDKVKIKTR